MTAFYLNDPKPQLQKLREWMPITRGKNKAGIQAPT